MTITIKKTTLICYALAAALWFTGAGGLPSIADVIGILTPVVQPATGPIQSLVIHEMDDAAKPEYKPYESVINSTAVRAYLSAHCSKTGNVPDWRFFDKDTPLANESPIWQTLMGTPHATLPWLVVARDGKVLASVALPNNEADTLALLKQYGGA